MAERNTFKDGNKFWEKRTKHGKDKLWSTPEILWEAACEYFEDCIDNPIIEVKPVSISRGLGNGSDIEMVEIPHIRAFTWSGLCLFLDCAQSYFREFKSSDRKDKEAYMVVIKRIEDTMFAQKFTGAAAGQLNASIIARDLGLADRSDVTSNGETLAVINPVLRTSSVPLASSESEVKDAKE